MVQWVEFFVWWMGVLAIGIPLALPFVAGAVLLAKRLLGYR